MGVVNLKIAVYQTFQVVITVIHDIKISKLDSVY